MSRRRYSFEDFEAGREVEEILDVPSVTETPVDVRRVEEVAEEIEAIATDDRTLLPEDASLSEDQALVRESEPIDDGEAGDAFSLEDLDVEDALATQEFEIQSDLDDIEKSVDVAYVLESLMETMRHIKSADHTNLRLIELVGDAACTGTDINPEHLVPNMEQYLGKEIALEGVKETIKAIWQKIQTTVKALWNKIQAFIHRLVHKFQQTSVNARKIDIAKIEALPSPASSHQTELTLSASVAQRLSVLGKPLLNFEEIQQGVARLTQANHFISSQYSDVLLDRAAQFQRVLKKFNPSAPRDSVYEAKKLLEQLPKPHVPAEYSSLMNGFGVHYDADSQNLNITHAPLSSASEYHFRVLKPAEISKLVKMKEALDESFKKLLGSGELLQRASGRLNDAIQSEVVNAILSDDSAGDSEHILLRLNQIYTRWVSQSYLAYMGHVLPVSDAIAHLIAANLAVHE